MFVPTWKNYFFIDFHVILPYCLEGTSFGGKIMIPDWLLRSLSSSPEISFEFLADCITHKKNSEQKRTFNSKCYCAIFTIHHSALQWSNRQWVYFEWLMVWKSEMVCVCWSPTCSTCWYTSQSSLTWFILIFLFVCACVHTHTLDMHALIYLASNKQFSFHNRFAIDFQ